MQNIKWVSMPQSDGNLPPPGIYAIAYCWDPHEGVFVGAGKWDGKQWAERLPTIEVSSVPFDSIEAAAAWADAHDEWC